jgi:hypothetical protein
MNSEAVVNIAVALLVPIVTALLGVLGVMFGDWRQRRTQEGRRKIALEDASRQVAFAAEWWNARKLLADSPQAEQEATTRAVGWLEEASGLVTESKLPATEDKPEITLRRLLLLYPLQSRAATVVRGVFYVCLALLPIQAGGIIHNTLDPSAPTDVLYSDIIWMLVVAVLALSLRFWAGRVDKPRPEGRKPSRVTLRHALLFYRFHRPAARIVRIIFYILALALPLLAAGLITAAWAYRYWLPGSMVQLVAFIGYAVALRYWAASLEATRKDGEADRVASLGPSPTVDDRETGKLADPRPYA